MRRARIWEPYSLTFTSVESHHRWTKIRRLFVVQCSVVLVTGASFSLSSSLRLSLLKIFPKSKSILGRWNSIFYENTEGHFSLLTWSRKVPAGDWILSWIWMWEWVPLLHIIVIGPFLDELMGLTLAMLGLTFPNHVTDPIHFLVLPWWACMNWNPIFDWWVQIS